MQLFLDTGNTDEIKHALEVWNIDGFTTNPRHVAAWDATPAEPEAATERPAKRPAAAPGR